MMKTTDQPAFQPIGLPPDQFAAAFPFHIALDLELGILQVGSSLRRLCLDAQPGASLHQIFHPIRPKGTISLDWVQQNTSRFFLLEHRMTKLLLRGEFMRLPGRDILVFLGSPWFTDSSEIAALGLNLEDFAIHDPVADMLQVFQANKMALEDSKKLTARLTAQRSELRQANERLRQQEAETRKLALIAERTDNAVVLTDATGKIIWANEGFTRITGYTLAEAAGKKPGSFLQGPDTDTETVRRIRGHLRNGEGFREEILNYGKHGRTYWLAIEVQPIRDDAGQITNFMAVESDITTRRAAQQRLAIQLEISTLLAGVNNLAAVVPRLLQVICENMGWQVGQCWRKTGEKLVFSDSWHLASASLPTFISASRVITFESGSGLPGRVWATGKPVWIQEVTQEVNFARGVAAGQDELHGAFGFPVMVSGQLWGVVEFFSRSISRPDDALLQTFTAVGNQLAQFIERCEAEEALSQTNALQRAMINGAGYAIIATNPTGVIQLFNRAAERMLGYAADEVIGKQSPGIFHVAEEVITRARELTDELGRVVQPGFEAFVAKSELGQPDQREWTYIHKNGDRFPVLLSVATLFDDHGRVTGYLGVASDLAERKRNEEKLRATLSELERFNRLMMNREERVLELKREINQLRTASHLPPAYPSADKNLDNPAKSNS